MKIRKKRAVTLTEIMTHREAQRKRFAQKAIAPMLLSMAQIRCQQIFGFVPKDLKITFRKP
jgi:predicted permease